jgi:hypothetical protein
MANTSKEALILEKVIFKLSDEVPELAAGTVDLDLGQLEDDPPAVQFPACLVDIVQVVYQQHQSAIGQAGTFQLRLKFAFDVNQDTEGRNSEDQRQAGLAYFDILNKVYLKMQYWKADGLLEIQEFRRLRLTVEKREDNIRIVNVDYQGTFVDRSAEA